MKKITSINLHSFWVIYAHSNEIIPIHTHPGLYAFTWYLDIPEEIRNESQLQHDHIRTRGTIQFISKRTNDTMEINPKTNDVLIFKTDHNHQIYPYHTDNIRISMAGNIDSITFEDGETITA
jgi:hypothetical protein